MTRLSNRLRTAGAAILIGLGVAYTASAQTPSFPDLDARIDRLTQDLDLTAEQTSSLDALAERYANAERPDLWAAAAEASDILTDAQIDQLRQAAEARRGERREARGERGDRRRGGRGMGPHGDRRMRGGDRGSRGDRGPRSERMPLTEEQREAIREIRTDVREQTEALVARFREGDLSDDMFVAQTKALHQEAARQSAEVLPAEVAERMAERQQRQEAEKAAREAALDLTDAQKAALQSRRLDRVREGQPDLRPFLDEDGQLDRQAFREAMRERMDATRAEREANPILTDEQEDVAFVHRALAGGGRGMRGPGRRGSGAGFDRGR